MNKLQRNLTTALRGLQHKAVPGHESRQGRVRSARHSLAPVIPEIQPDCSNLRCGPKLCECGDSNRVRVILASGFRDFFKAFQKCPLLPSGRRGPRRSGLALSGRALQRRGRCSALVSTRPFRRLDPRRQGWSGAGFQSARDHRSAFAQSTRLPPGPAADPALGEQAHGKPAASRSMLTAPWRRPHTITAAPCLVI